MNLHAVKLVMSNGVIEDCKEAVVILKQGDGMSLEAINLLPNDQFVLVSIAFHQYFNEYFLEDGEDNEMLQVFEHMLRTIISSLLNNKPTTEGKLLS